MAEYDSSVAGVTSIPGSLEPPKRDPIVHPLNYGQIDIWAYARTSRMTLTIAQSYNLASVGRRDASWVTVETRK
jgi:hypothetical protein